MEQSTFQFEIISPSQTQLLTVEWIEIESPTGGFFVGPGHSNLVSIIKNKSIMTCKKADGQTLCFDVARGIFKVNENKAIALIDQ